MAGTVFRTHTQVSRELRAALGDICVHFAMLENTMDRTIWKFLGVDRRVGRLTTLRMMTTKRIKRIRREYMAKFGDKSAAGKAYKDAADHASCAADARNLYVHGLWGRRDIPGMRRKQFVLTYFTSHEGQHQEVLLADMKQLVEIIDAVNAEFWHCCRKYFGGPLP